jgi:hypothetical protein
MPLFRLHLQGNKATIIFHHFVDMVIKEPTLNSVKLLEQTRLYANIIIHMVELATVVQGCVTTFGDMKFRI